MRIYDLTSTVSPDVDQNHHFAKIKALSISSNKYLQYITIKITRAGRAYRARGERRTSLRFLFLITNYPHNLMRIRVYLLCSFLLLHSHYNSVYCTVCTVYDVCDVRIKNVRTFINHL